MLKIDGLTYKFGKKAAVDGLSFEFTNGVYGLLGPNGSGKTTLMNMIAGIYYPDHGQIFIDGKEVVIRSPKDALDYKIGTVSYTHLTLPTNSRV